MQPAREPFTVHWVSLTKAVGGVVAASELLVAGRRRRAGRESREM